MLQIKVVSPLPLKIVLYDMHASDDTGHHDAGSVLPTFGGVKLQRSNVRAKNPILGGSGGLLPRGHFEL